MEMFVQYYQSLNKCTIDTEDNDTTKAHFNLENTNQVLFLNLKKRTKIWVLI